jgi:uncharacterized protein (TIGR03435 family)
MSIAVRLGLIVLVAGAAWGQAPPAFEVASIKLHAGPSRAIRMAGISGSRFSATNNSLLGLITYAYNLKIYEVAGGPGWISDYASFGWDIEAKAAGDGALTREQARQMLQTLLADRFQLKVHREMKEMAVYALVVAGRGGVKLKVSAPDAEERMTMRGGRTIQIETTKGGMEQLVTQISGTLGQPVLDKTGLTSEYDYRLEFAPQSAWAADADADAPTIFTALQEQLGLRLESQKAPVEIVVIDHAEKPSEN